MFEAGAPLPLNAGMIELTLPDYNLSFLYGLTCDAELGRSSVVKAQLDQAYCSGSGLLHPHCTTHQMMGVL